MEQHQFNSAALVATKEISALFEIANENRKAAWHYRLLTCLPHALFSSGEPEIIFNQAGFTYYNLEVLKELDLTQDDAKTYTVPALIDTFLINEGVGIAIEAHEPNTAIDLCYGDVLGFHLHRTFSEPNEHPFKTDKPRAGMIQAGADILINEVPVEVLPAATIQILTAIMTHYGVSNPAIKLIYLPQTEQNEIVFSVDPSELSQEKQQALIQKLGWFMPRYYSYLACDLNQIDPIIDIH